MEKCDVCESSFKPRTIVGEHDIIAAHGTFPDKPEALGHFSIRISNGIGHRAKLCPGCVKKVIQSVCDTL